MPNLSVDQPENSDVDPQTVINGDTMSRPTIDNDKTASDEDSRPQPRIRWRRVIAIYIIGGMLCTGMYVAGQAYVVRGRMDNRPATHSRIAVGRLRHDFGRVRPGTTLRHAFKIENNGPGNFALQRRDRDRDGKKAEKIVIPPGESRRVEFTLRAPGRPGRMQEFVDWSTNDPDRPRIRFTAIATVRKTNADKRPEERSQPPHRPDAE